MNFKLFDFMKLEEEQRRVIYTQILVINIVDCTIHIQMCVHFTNILAKRFSSSFYIECVKGESEYMCHFKCNRTK